MKVVKLETFPWLVKQPFSLGNSVRIYVSETATLRPIFMKDSCLVLSRFLSGPEDRF